MSHTGETGISICLDFLSFLPLLFRPLPEGSLKLPHLIDGRINPGR